MVVVERHRGKSWQESKDLIGDPSREVVWWLARRHAGLPLAQLGAEAGPTDYAAVAMALKRFESKMKGNQIMKAEMQKLERRMLNVNGLLSKALAVNFSKNGSHK